MAIPEQPLRSARRPVIARAGVLLLVDRVPRRRAAAVTATLFDISLEQI
jgi:hypothetical protein